MITLAKNNADDVNLVIINNLIAMLPKLWLQLQIDQTVAR